MPLSFLTGKNKIINVVFKDHVIRYIEMKQTNPPVVNRCGEHYLPAGIIRDGKIVDFVTLQSILEQCIDDWKIAKRQVRFLVPDSYVVIRNVEIPLEVKNDEMEGYLYLELGTSIHLPFEDPVFDFVHIGETETKKELLLFAAPEKVVGDYTELLEECKLVPVAADISPLSLYRLYFLAGQSSPEERLLLIQFDLETVNASIFSGSNAVFSRHIPISAGSDDWELEEMHSVQPELVYTGSKDQYFNLLEDTYKELERVISFYKYSLNAGKADISKILLAGDHPFLQEIYMQMKSRFPVEVAEINSEWIRQTKEDAILPPSFHSVVGLALKGVK